MVEVKDFGNYETAWCPGCGNFGLLTAVKKALAESGLAPHQVMFFSGIGQAAKAPHYLNCNLFDGLHGRSVPAATGARLARPEMTVIAESGDGDNYGEGGNHFLAAVRRNPNLTMLVHDNKVYGLTKGQASPTSPAGFKTKVQPMGTPSGELNPLTLALVAGAGFVARGFSGKIDHLAGLIKQAIAYRGYALVDILQVCVTYNHVNDWKFYNQRCKETGKEHDPSDWRQAFELAGKWGDEIPIGIIYKGPERETLEDHFPALKQGSLAGRAPSPEALREMMDKFY